MCLLASSVHKNLIYFFLLSSFVWILTRFYLILTTLIWPTSNNGQLFGLLNTSSRFFFLIWNALFSLQLKFFVCFHLRIYLFLVTLSGNYIWLRIGQESMFGGQCHCSVVGGLVHNLIILEINIQMLNGLFLLLKNKIKILLLLKSFFFLVYWFLERILYQFIHPHCIRSTCADSIQNISLKCFPVRSTYCLSNLFLTANSLIKVRSILCDLCI